MRQSEKARLRRLSYDVVGRSLGHTLLDQFVNHQLLHTVVHVCVGKVAAELFRQGVVPFPSHLLYDRIAPFPSQICKILLYIGSLGDLLLAHYNVIFCCFRVPFARNFEYLIRVAHRLCRRRHHAQYTAQRGGILLHFLALFLREISLCLRHDGCEVALEIVAHKAFYLRKLPAMLDSIHIVSLYIYLFQQLFFRLLDGVVINLHLAWEELLQPFVLFDVVMYEAYSLFPFYLYRGFTLFTVIEPCFRPPPHTCPVGIYRNNPRYIETLYIDIQFRQRVDETAERYGFVIKFFFTSPPIEGR